MRVENKASGTIATARRRYAILAGAAAGFFLVVLGVFISQSTGVRQLYWMIAHQFSRGG